jgi:hypothetical protein
VDSVRRTPSAPLVGGRDAGEGGGAVALRLSSDRQFGQVIDVFVSGRRNTMAAHRFFQRAIGPP